MKSIEDLKAIKERNIGDVIARGEKGLPHVNVHMGTCGITAGAREVVLAILEEIRAQDLAQIHVVQSDCPGMCYNEPMMTVTMPGEKPYVYIKLTPENARSVIDRHVKNHQPVQEWLLNE